MSAVPREYSGMFFLTSGPKPKDIQFIVIEEHENQKNIHF